MSSSAQLFTIIAHRGASGSAPENTLAAIELAIANKADMIEIDIHQTKDGKLVVIHDDKLDRTTTGKGKINELTLEEIKKHDAGSWFNTSFSNEKVPELKEVLELINGKCKLLIEIKGKPSDYSGLEKKLIEEINKHNAKDWVIIQSFNTGFVENIYSLDSSLTVCKLIVMDIPLFPLYFDDGLRFGSLNRFKKFHAINPDHQFAGKRLISKIKKQNQKIFCWTVNNEADAKKLKEKGVDGIITNFPEKMLQHFK